MVILETRDLTKVYQNGSNMFEAVSHINLSIEKGTFVAIVGKSGSGKSTLLHMLGGLDSPTEGEVLIDGKNIVHLNSDERTLFRRRKIGFIFQKYNLVPILSVYENIILPINIDNKKLDKDFLERILQTLGIADKVDRYPEHLSGGEQQRVAIARALISKPDIILADEPTGNLDKKTGIEVMELLREANEEFQQTIIMITHDEEFARLTKQIIRIEDGKIIGGDQYGK